MRVRRLSESESLAFAGLTYPDYRRFLGGRDPREFIFVGAELDDIPVGLAFGVADGEWYEVIGLNAEFDGAAGEVREDLLRLLMAEFARTGRHRAVFHPTLQADDKVTPALLRRCGWSAPIVRQVSASTTVDKMLSVPFVNLGALRDGYAVLPWSEVGPALRDRANQALDAIRPEVRRDIDPFIYEKRAVLEQSFMLVRGEEPIGWHLPERLDDVTMRWTCSTVLPGKWAMAAVFLMWFQALNKQRELGIPGIIFGVPIVHPNMLRFVTTRIRSRLDSLLVTATFSLTPATP